jgi:hypothetical protein
LAGHLQFYIAKSGIYKINFYNFTPDMTSNHYKILLLLVVFVIVQPLNAQGPPPPGLEDPLPVTEWLLVLAASGALYGFRKKLKK